MTNYFGHYPKLYVKNKRELFPIIEKYYGGSVKGMTHNQVIGIYLDLLKYNPAFVEEVDQLAIGKYKNVFGLDLSGLNQAAEAASTASTTVKSSGGFDPVTAVANLFSSIFNKQTAEQEGDNLFYETILTEQKKDDTMKILIVSGIALAFVGLGVFMVVKLRK